MFKSQSLIGILDWLEYFCATSYEKHENSFTPGWGVRVLYSGLRIPTRIMIGSIQTLKDQHFTSKE